MEIVPSTFMALAAVAGLFWLGPYRGLWLFIGLTPFGAAAAVNLPAVGGSTLGLIEFAVAPLLLIAAMQLGGIGRMAGTLRPGQPGFWFLLIVTYGLISAAFFPRIFIGQTEVFSLSRAVNEDGIIAIPLRPSSGNITQSFYTLLAAACFLATATLYRIRPDHRAVLRALAVATVINFVFGWLDVLTVAAGLEVLMEPFRTANYDIAYTATMAGMKRMIGAMPEASSYGSYSLILTGFWLHYWIVSPRDWRTGLMLAFAAFSTLRATSSGAYVALAALLAIYGSGWLVVAARRGLSPRVAALLVVGLAGAWLTVIFAVLGYQTVPVVREFFDDSLLTKLESESGVERMSWNVQALRNFADTFMIGAGLGSLRASNWFISSLGSIGLLGTAFYIAFLGSVARAPQNGPDADRNRVIGALKLACLAQVIASMPTAATPNLGTFFAILAGLAVGLSRSTAVGAAQARQGQLEARRSAVLRREAGYAVGAGPVGTARR